MDNVNHFHILSGPGSCSRERQCLWFFSALYQSMESKLWKLIFTPSNRSMASMRLSPWGKELSHIWTELALIEMSAKTGVRNVGQTLHILRSFSQLFGIFCFYVTSRLIRNLSAHTSHPETHMHIHGTVTVHFARDVRGQPHKKKHIYWLSHDPVFLSLPVYLCKIKYNLAISNLSEAIN